MALRSFIFRGGGIAMTVSVKEKVLEASEALASEGHIEKAREDQMAAGLMKPNLVRALIQRGALR